MSLGGSIASGKQAANQRTRWSGDSDNEDLDSVSAHPSLAQRRTDLIVFGMEGEADDLDDMIFVDNMTGTSSRYTETVAQISGRGQGLTFVGETLYLASGMELYTIDLFTGRATLVADMTLTGFATGNGLQNPRIASMTTRPSDNQVFGILKEGSSSAAISFLVSINVGTGLVTNIGQTEEILDGITWVPADYFQE